MSTFLRRAAHAICRVLLPWFCARVLVVGVLAAARYLVDRVHPENLSVVARVHEGLLGWDAGWYKSIASSGYGSLSNAHQALRFFPLFPIIGKVLTVVPGMRVGAALIVVANVSTLLGTALFRVLVLRETGDAPLAERTVWLFSFLPPAFVFVMGYAEGLLLVLTVGCFVALRSASGRAQALKAQDLETQASDAPLGATWGIVAFCGMAAGLTRPLGVLLLLPVAVEARRRWRAATARERFFSLGAAAAPVIGLGAFLLWVQRRYGDGLLPLRIQVQHVHHGGIADPFTTILDDARGILHHHPVTALHVVWVLLAAGLLVVTWRRLPACYGAFATAVVLVAASGANLDSFERYAMSAFPLVMAGAICLTRPRLDRAVITLAGAGLVVYSLFAFCNLLVP